MVQTLLSSSTVQAVHTAAWGALTPPSWVRLVVETLPNLSDGSTRILLRTRVDPHQVTSPYFRGPGPTKSQQVFQRPGGEVGVSHVLTDRDLAALTEDQIFRLVFFPAIRSLAWFLYEHDPRIGAVPDNLTSFPRSPLFDPSRMRPPMNEGLPALDSVPCPFCQNAFGRGMPAMWGGGNLLWVHPSCWARAHAPL